MLVPFNTAVNKFLYNKSISLPATLNDLLNNADSKKLVEFSFT